MSSFRFDRAKGSRVSLVTMDARLAEIDEMIHMTMAYPMFEWITPNASVSKFSEAIGRAPTTVFRRIINSDVRLPQLNMINNYLESRDYQLLRNFYVYELVRGQLKNVRQFCSAYQLNYPSTRRRLTKKSIERTKLYVDVFYANNSNKASRATLERAYNVFLERNSEYGLWLATRTHTEIMRMKTDSTQGKEEDEPYGFQCHIY